MTQIKKEFYILVDVETNGPNPGNYAMSSIGACTLHEPRETFYIELIPDKPAFTDEALSVSMFSLDYLYSKGVPPKDAMLKFKSWVESVCPHDAAPVFTAFNAPFDWMFVNDYFYRYLNENPFGHKALDLKAFYMAKENVQWEETSFVNVAEKYLGGKKIEHNALKDAIDTAIIFEAMLNNPK